MSAADADADADAVDVLVVGAGPAGSASAILLARQGHRVTVVDRAAFPREKACSEYMSPATVLLLDRLGVLAELDAAGGHALAGTDVIAPRGARLAGRFVEASRAPFRSTGLSLSRRVLDARLVRAAREAGAVVLERTTVEQLVRRGDAVAGAVVRDAVGARRTLHARLTIGADGLRSIVARRIGRQVHGRPRRMAFVAYVAGVTGLGASAEMHVGADGYVGLNPIGGGVANVALVVPVAHGAAARGRAVAFFFEALERFAGVRGRVHPGGLVRGVLATGPFASHATRVVADGALLVGDAADFFDPFTGEGIFAALRGAELAAHHAGAALAAAPGIVPARRLAGYRTARRGAFAGKWAVERLIGYAMWSPALFDHAVRRIGRRRGMADTLVGVTGDLVPARAVLNPFFLARMVF